MTLLTTTCPRCTADVEVPVSSLLVALVSGAADGDDSGRLAFICPACSELADQPVSLRTVIRLAAAGCVPLEVVSEEKR